MEGPARRAQLVANGGGDAIGAGDNEAGVAGDGSQAEHFGEGLVVQLAVVRQVAAPFPQAVVGGDGQPLRLSQHGEGRELAVAEFAVGAVEGGGSVEPAADGIVQPAVGQPATADNPLLTRVAHWPTGRSSVRRRRCQLHLSPPEISGLRCSGVCAMNLALGSCPFQAWNIGGV